MYNKTYINWNRDLYIVYVCIISCNMYVILKKHLHKTQTLFVPHNPEAYMKIGRYIYPRSVFMQNSKQVHVCKNIAPILYAYIIYHEKLYSYRQAYTYNICKALNIS